jgi:hypothetical protein
MPVNCAICGKLHGRKANAKFCVDCAHKAYYQIRNARMDRRVHSPKMDWDADSYLSLSPTQTDWAPDWRSGAPTPSAWHFLEYRLSLKHRLADLNKRGPQESQGSFAKGA